MSVFWNDVRELAGDEVAMRLAELHSGKRATIPEADLFRACLEREELIRELYRAGRGINSLKSEFQIGTEEFYRIVNRKPAQP